MVLSLHLITSQVTHIQVLVLCYFYVKKEHVGVIPGIKEFLSEFVSERSNELGWLLVPSRTSSPLSDDDYAKQVTAQRDSL